MLLEIVRLVSHAGDAALRMVSIGIVQAALRHEDHPAMPGYLQRIAQPRDTGTDHQKVTLSVHYGKN